MTVASLHVARFTVASAAPRGLQLLRGWPRPARWPGLRFAKAFATGDLWTVPAPKPTPARFALFAIWDDEWALDNFLSQSRLMEAWRGGAREAYHLRLEPQRSHGTWDGSDPLGAIEAGEQAPGPIAILTYGRLKARHTARFWRSNAKAVRELEREPGVLASIGMVSPPNTNVTFSLWRSLDDAVGFAHQQPDHREAMRRMHAESWHHEYLFARFRPFAWEGTMGGRDPLGPAR